MEEVQPEVEEARGDRPLLEEDVLLTHVPAARAHHEGRRPLHQAVLPAVRRLVPDGAPHRVHQVELALDHVVPGGGEGVLQVRHEDLRA
ncbi:hypothetical protein D3C87_1966810 [compost metagenome]